MISSELSGSPPRANAQAAFRFREPLFGKNRPDCPLFQLGMVLWRCVVVNFLAGYWGLASTALPCNLELRSTRRLTAASNSWADNSCNRLSTGDFRSRS